MKREIDINEITDGKKYTRRDMVKVGCNDCEGCSACCHDMECIVLDPWDICQMTGALGCSFESIIDKYIELKVLDGVILPHMKLDGKNNGCHFLSEEGRCRIHLSRPGICRLFPLGILYEDDKMSYILQTKECAKTNRTKMKVEKWLGIHNLPEYEKFKLKWHSLLKKIEAEICNLSEEQQRTLQMLMLREFFVAKFDETKFYEQFNHVYGKITSMLGL